MRFGALLVAVVLCGCQPVQTQGQAPPPAAASALPAQPPAWTEARAYLADVRAALNVAYLRDRETTVSGDCDSPRFEDITPPATLAVEACRLSIGSSAEYRVEARFSDGSTWIADPDGIRPVEPAELSLLKEPS